MGITLQGEAALRAGLEQLLSTYPLPFAGLCVDVEAFRLPAGGPALTLDAGDGGARIGYRRTCDFFRALSLLAMGETRAAETRAYEKCGAMLDVSRNAVYTVAQVKEFLCWLALCGLNTCYLYMEDTYELAEYPYFGYLRGRYTQAELREIDDFAFALGIEAVPCIQTLAHLATTLKWEYAEPLRDTANTLLVGAEETYRLIETMLRTLKSTFRTRRVHIGMDEAMDLGTGAALRKNGFTPQFDLMLAHLQRVTGLAEGLGLSPIIWDDMFYRAKDENHEYYNPAVALTEADRARVPQKVCLAYWDYYHNTQEEYDCLLAKRDAFENPVMFAGGIWKWNGWVPNYGKTFTATRAALSACQNHRVGEILATMWADNGAEAPLHTVWPGLVLFGQYAYGAAVDDAAVSRRCEALAGLSLEGFRAIEEIDLPPGCERPNLATRNPAKTFLYNDLLLGAFDGYALKPGLAAHWQAAAARLEALAEEVAAPAMRPVLVLYARLAGLLADKACFGAGLRAAYAAQDRARLAALAHSLGAMKDKAAALHDAARTVWFASCKGAGFEVQDIRLGGLAARIETTQKRLSAYLHGEIEGLDELEQAPLPFLLHSLGAESYPCYNKYQNIATQNLI